MTKLTKIALANLMLFVASQTANANDNVVYLYTWSEYVPEGLLENFTKETGIKVISSNLESNETMYAKLKALGSNSGYDVIAPSGYFVSKMAREGMLKELDHSKLPVIKELDPDMLDKPFDKGNKYSLPQLFGASGIGYNTDTQDPAKLQSWGDLWRPEFVNKLQVFDDSRELFSIALLKMGQDPNTQDLKIIEQAYQELLKLRPHILAFNSDNPASGFVTGEVDVGLLWNGSVYVAKNEGVPVNIIYPKEGSIFWLDNLAIPKTAKHVDAAYKLINYLLSADVSEKLTLTIGYPTSNMIARSRLPKTLTEDPAFFISKDVLKRGWWQVDVGDAAEIYEAYYQKLKNPQ